MASRWEPISQGALVMATYNGAFDSITDAKGVVQSIDHIGLREVVIDKPLDGTVLQYDPDSEDFGTITIRDTDHELYAVEEVVPPGQVRHPGVEAGDTVKVGTGSAAYKVESVDSGMVELEDKRTVPVTTITAFDEDVNDYDPFNIIPGPIGDIFGGDGR